MPMYDFRCDKCFHVWNEFYWPSEVDSLEEDVKNEKIDCPECKKPGNITFFFPSPAVKFLGEKGNSGFYSVDYKK